MKNVTDDTLSPASAAFRERAHRVIPGGSHTYSRGDDQLPANAPAGFVRGRGARAWDIEGAEFVDWGMGINNVLIGHAETAIDDAAVAALREGQALSRPTPREVDAAEMALSFYPGMEMAKFAKNGSDANSSAIRLARAITGRDLVAYDETAPFLSIHDWFIGRTLVSAGVPDAIRNLSVPFRLNDVASVDRLFSEHPRKIAAVVLEVCRDERPAPGFLEVLRSKCDEDGALLIFDEVVTGFRYGLNGATGLFGVTPDFTSIGKGMANGYALAALLGKRDYMDRGGLRHGHERVFFLSTTNGPEQSALAAGLATMQFYRDQDVIAHIHDVGAQLMRGIAECAERHGIAGYVSAASAFDARPMLRFLDRDRQVSMPFRTLFLQELCSRRVFMPWICASFRHGAAEIGQTLDAVDAACGVYARALEQGSADRFLRGPAVRPVFRKFN